MITADREQLRADRGTPRRLPDVAVAVLSAVLLAVVSAHIPAASGGRALDVLGYALLVVAGLAMGACRHRPRLAALVITAVLCTFVARDYPDGPVWLTGVIALGVLSRRTDRRTAVVGAVVMLAALTVAATATGSFSYPVSLIYVGWVAAAVFFGEALRSRRSYVTGLAERARITQRSREEETARRVAEERLRIARDLHDSVAHAMATISVQAGAAAYVLERRPEAAGEALSAIQRASAEVLDELAGMLSVLRDDAERAERAPAPGLGDVARLAESAGRNGLAVDLQITQPAAVVPPGLATAAYRVVQESLTNVLRHSQARQVQVCVAAGPAGALRIEIRDPGPARAHDTSGTGVGIRGMRERSTATGGQFAAGPTLDGGFAVQAEWDAPG